MDNIKVSYNNIINELEKKIYFTKNGNLKNILIEKYIKFLIELSRFEKKDYNFYENKLDMLNISSERKREILDEIKYKTIPENVLEEERFLYFKLKEDFKNPNDLLINTWVNNYRAFLNRYSSILYGFYNEDTIGKYISEFDREGNYKIISNVESLKNEEKTEFLIKNIRSPYSNKKNLSDKIKFFISKGSFIPSDLKTYFIYLGYRSNDINNPNFENDYQIDMNGNLVKNDGSVIDSYLVQKEKSNFIKRLLLNNHGDGEIPNKYKDNRLKTLLMDMYIVRKSNRNVGIKNVSEVSSNIDIHKGMGKC